MKIKKATTKRLERKIWQLVHDGFKDHRFYHILNELRLRKAK